MSVIPKPASTVVLMDDLSRVYLTQRPVTMKFMGGFHVFPGGAVEEEDNHLHHIIGKIEVPDASLSPGYYMAAARELFEEVGILIGTREDGTPALLSKEKEIIYRKKLINNDISFNHVLEEERLKLELDCLSYIGQIITPEDHPIRFDTRFFLAKLPQGQSPDPDRNEIDEALWIHPGEALEALETRKIKLAPPTIITLETIISHLDGGKLHMSPSTNDLKKYFKYL